MKKLSYLYEIPLFYVLFYGLNYFVFPTIPAFYDVTPHPYWIGVLLFSFRYGFLAGGFSGLIAAALYLYVNFEMGDRYRFEDYEFYILPFCFFVFGVGIGLAVQRYHTKIFALNAKVTRFTKNISELQKEVEDQTAIIRELEKKIVSKMITLVTLYEGARQLESLYVDEILASTLKFVCTTIEAKEASLYLKNENGWQLYDKIGWKENDQWPSFYQHDQGLVGKAGSSKKIVSIRDVIGGASVLENTQHKGDNILLDVTHEALLAGPVVSGEKNEVQAVIAIHTMPLIHFNSATINLFSFLLSWISRSMGKALYYEELKESEVIDPELRVYSQKYFIKRLSEEFQRSKTYYLPMSVCLINIEEYKSLSTKHRQPILMVLSQLLKESSRDIDVVARYSDEHALFACLLITSTESQSEQFKEKVKENFKKINLKRKLTLQVGLAHFSPKVQSVGLLLEQGRQNITSELGK